MVKLARLGPTYTLYKTHIHPMFPTPQALFQLLPRAFSSLQWEPNAYRRESKWTFNEQLCGTS